MKSIFNQCGYPEYVVTRNIEKALLPRKKPTTEKERFAIIKLPYIGKVPSRKFSSSRFYYFTRGVPTGCAFLLGTLGDVL